MAALFGGAAEMIVAVMARRNYASSVMGRRGRASARLCAA
jgi:hypothetical protein